MTLTIPPAPESIALIDISYLFAKRWHSIPLGEKNAAAIATLRDIEDLKNGVGHVIICRDAPPYSHRLALFPEYKANRPKPEPEEVAQKKWLWQEIGKRGYSVGFCEGYEADDVIATLAKSYSEWCDDVRIVGTDKDCAQCITEHVKQYIPPIGTKDWEKRDIKAVWEKFKVAPGMMPLYQGLVGDKTDNIPGVPDIGPVTAAKLVNDYPSPELLAAGVASGAIVRANSKLDAKVKSLAANWEKLVMSMKLATLDTAVPLDTQALLSNCEPVAPLRSMSDAALDEASQLYQAKLPELKQVATKDRAQQEYENDPSPRAAKDAELLEREYDREREQQAENDTVSNEPGDKAGESVVVPRHRPSQALVVVPQYSESKYGLVTKDLQPLDLLSAKTVSMWLFDGGVFQQYKSEQEIFTIIARGKELGIGMTTALAAHHMVDKKPVAHADLIRALAERDPNFDYLTPTKMSATSVTWEGKHRRQPKAVEYTYTIEDARLALGMRDKAGVPYFRKDKYGNPGNWETRPQDMLMKTAGSKLARLLWPGATLGMYCPEEMGYSQEELEAA